MHKFLNYSLFLRSGMHPHEATAEGIQFHGHLVTRTSWN